MTTATEIIRAALGNLGIVAPGEAVKANDAEDCLAMLNDILDGWKVERLYAYCTQAITYITPGETQTLTIGDGGQINIPERPERFEAGCFYRLSGIDYPLTSVNEAEYNAVPVKDVTALGEVCFWYEPTLPLGSIKFYPRLVSNAQISLIAQQRMSAFADLTTDYTLPAGAKRALIFTLTEEAAPRYEREIPPTVAKNAANARRVFKRGNLTVPQLSVGGESSSDVRARLFGGAT